MVGGRTGNRDTNQPNGSNADGIWKLQEAYDARWRNSWPVSWGSGFGFSWNSHPTPSVAATCVNSSATLTASAGRASGWADPLSYEWQKSLSNSNTPNTGNPWLSEYFYHEWGSAHPLNPQGVYATGLSPSPLVLTGYTAFVSSPDPLFSQVTLLTNFNNGCFDFSPSRREFLVRRGGSLTTAIKRNGTRSFTNGAISYYGPQTISGDFTIEGWFWFDETTTKRTLFSLGTLSADGGHAKISLNADNIEYQKYGSDPAVLTATVIDSQEWVHLAIVRSGSTVRLYVNGVAANSTTHSGTVGDTLLAGNMQLFCRQNDYIDEFRITNSARYSANFTPSASPFLTSSSVPQVTVSAAGSVAVNGTYSPVATGDAGWDAKQFYASNNGTCIFWHSPTGHWVISRGSASGPAGDRNYGYSGNWLYISDGSVWSPVLQTPPAYEPPGASLSLGTLAFLDNETYYRVRAASGFNDAASKKTLVISEPIAITFPVEPQDQNAVDGAATFSAAAAGTGQITGNDYGSFAYQWQKRANESSSFTNIGGQRGTSTTLSGLIASDNGSQVRLRASCGSLNIAYSRIATVYVGSPTAPTALFAAPGDSQVSLTWTAPASQGDSPITDYAVQYSADGGVSWVTFSDGTSTATSATVTGLTNGISYIFRVAGVNSVGRGPYSAISNRVVPSPAGTDAYFSYVSFVSNFDGDNNSTTFEDQSLAARAVTRYGDAKISTTTSKWGSAAYFDGNGDYLSVSDPDAFKIGNQDFTIEAWIYPTSVGGSTRAFATTADPIDSTGFWLGIHPNGNTYWLLGNSGSWATARDVFGLSANQWYHVAICRSAGVARLYVNGVQRDSFSNSTNVSNANGMFRIGGRAIGNQYFQGYIGGLRFTKGINRYPAGATFSVPGSPFPTSAGNATAPDAPAVVTATGGTRQAVVSWASPANNGSGIRDYLVQYSSNGGVAWNNFSDGTSRSTTATVTGLADNTTYIFRVAAVNYIGTGPWSTASGSVTTNALPGSPTGVSGTPGNEEITLSWTAPSSDGGDSITGYRVEYTPSGGSASFVNTGSSLALYTVSGLSNGTSYTFRVAAITAVGTGPYSSASSSLSPLATVPGAPTSLTGTPGDGQASLTWASPSNNGGSSITDYVVEYSSDNGSTWTAFSHTASSAASIIVTGLTNGTSYKFRVAASNSAGTGAYSTVSGAVTPSAFAPMAVILTSGTSYSVPVGATSMKAWAVGAGTDWKAGGVAYKTWSASGGTTVSYSLAPWNYMDLPTDPTTITYDGTTITAGNGYSSTPYSGGDGGAGGGGGFWNEGRWIGGAVGGNSAGIASPCGRSKATDVSGLLAAVSLAGGKAVEDCGSTPAFGSGGASGKYSGESYDPGIGGGPGYYTQTPGAPAVVLYFT